MNKQQIGWLFVGVQLVLLVSLVALPTGEDWSTTSWITALGWGIAGLGAALVVIASLRLGSSLTPTPVPNEHGELTTQGLYRLVRHPIYSGVLAIVLGIVIRSGSLWSVALGLVTASFFLVKARWEEQQLTEHYPDYAAYAARTPRFIPMPWRRGLR